MLDIESNIPLPEDTRPLIKTNWPHEGMEIGQSFFVKGKSIISVCIVNKRYGKKLGRVFTARKQEDGIRVWRLE